MKISDTPAKVASLLHEASALLESMAADACDQRSPYEVYTIMQESIALRVKADKINRRWGTGR